MSVDRVDFAAKDDDEGDEGYLECPCGCTSFFLLTSNRAECADCGHRYWLDLHEAEE